MNWIESNHRRDEERIKRKWEEDELKVEAHLYQIGETLKDIEFINGVTKEIIKINNFYISDESNEEYTSYQLKERKLSGYISSALVLSPYLIEKYKLNVHRVYPVFNAERILNLSYKCVRDINEDIIRKTCNIHSDYDFIESDCRLQGRVITLTFGIPTYKYTRIEEKNIKLECRVVGLHDNKEMLRIFFVIPTDFN